MRFTSRGLMVPAPAEVQRRQQGRSVLALGNIVKRWASRLRSHRGSCFRCDGPLLDEQQPPDGDGVGWHLRNAVMSLAGCLPQKTVVGLAHVVVRLYDACLMFDRDSRGLSREASVAPQVHLEAVRLLSETLRGVNSRIGKDQQRLCCMGDELLLTSP